MQVTENELRANLFEYRKAIRAMMWFYDTSERLYEILYKGLENIAPINNYCHTKGLTEFITEDDDRNSGVSFSAYEEILNGTNHWFLLFGTEEDLKLRKNSMFIEIALYLDFYPKKKPSDSISALLVSGYNVNKVNGRATHSFDTEISESLIDPHKIDENSEIDEDGSPKKIMPLKNYGEICKWHNEKYSLDYAVGLYDLSTLMNEEVVQNTVIKDIENLIKQWG